MIERQLEGAVKDLDTKVQQFQDAHAKISFLQRELETRASSPAKADEKIANLTVSAKAMLWLKYLTP